MAVHMYGNPVDMDAYEQFGIPVIEDAAHAHGGDLNNRKTGTLGLISCFSFFQTKNMGGLSDGGMVLTDDADLAEKIRILHDVGQKTKHDHVMRGFNYRMSEFNASFLNAVLLKDCRPYNGYKHLSEPLVVGNRD